MSEHYRTDGPLGKSVSHGFLTCRSLGMGRIRLAAITDCGKTVMNQSVWKRPVFCGADQKDSQKILLTPFCPVQPTGCVDSVWKTFWKSLILLTKMCHSAIRDEDAEEAKFPGLNNPAGK